MDQVAVVTSTATINTYVSQLQQAGLARGWSYGDGDLEVII
jgi:hypothetical protein